MIKFAIRKPFLFLAIMAIFIHCNTPDTENIGWLYTGGDPGHHRYSALDQINKENVHQLKKAWVYHSENGGDDHGGNVQCNPLIINDNLYVTTANQHLVALKADTGKEVWRFNPEEGDQKFGSKNRGIAFWSSGEEERLVYTCGKYLVAVDKKNGTAAKEFGNTGRVDMSQGLSRPAEEMGIQSPGVPVIYKNLVIVGIRTYSADSHVSAYDVRTGERVWIFNTVPHPGEYGYDTWGDTTFYKTGAGVNTWGGISVDHENGMVFFGTGQPKPDYYRPNNKGKHLFGNSVLALNASTGKRIWHFQIIHKDLWDLDVSCPPILTELTYDNRKIPGLIQLSKLGNIYLFNRITGKLLSEVVETPVPASTLDFETSYPTQPKVLWPESYARQFEVKESDLTRLSDEAHLEAKRRFDELETGWFVPPSEKGILYYGIHGGSEWGGGAVDPETNMMYVNANELAWSFSMEKVEEGVDLGYQTFQSNCASCHLNGQQGVPSLDSVDRKYSRDEISNIIKRGRRAMPSFAHLKREEIKSLTNYLLKEKTKNDGSEIKSPKYIFSGYQKFLDKDGYPATKPPWGTLSAINLETGKIQWKVPLGEFVELTAKGIPITGTENFGSSIVTKGGLVFIAATLDKKIRAFDKDSGEVLWEANLPYGGYSQPSTYFLNGKQYIVIPATGGGKLGPPTGDAFVAFSL